MEYVPYIPSEVSAWATPVLINREPLLKQIQQAIADESGKTWLFFITGEGGIGKTRLVQEILRRCQKDAQETSDSWYSPGLFAAPEPVDLYHPYLHSELGLVRAIRAVIDPGPGYFEEYRTERDLIQRAKRDSALLTREMNRRRQALLQIFLDNYNAAAEDYRLVLALDTAEVIVDEPDPLQRGATSAQIWVDVQRWLAERFVPQISNTVLLIAGRPEATQLGQKLQTIADIHFEHVQLEPFKEQDTLAYFQAVIDTARDVGQEEVADRIAAVPKETRQVIHHYTGGKPILLALMIDYLAVADRLLPAVQVSLAEALRQTADEASLQQVQDSLKADLVRVSQETGRDTDETLRAMAWAPRGMDAELLAYVSTLGGAINNDDIAQAQEALDQVCRPLSFVKVRPYDRRAFLHDEMYSLLESHVLGQATEVRRTKITQAILKYYRQRIIKLRQKIEQPDLPDEELIDAYADLYSAQVEEVYYQLWADPVTGFQVYYRYAEEAFWNDTPELDQELHTELRRYLRQVGPSSIRQFVETDRLIRQVKWAFQEGQWDEIIRLARQARENHPDLFTDPLSDAELSAFEGVALIYQGVHFDLAESTFQGVIKNMYLFEPTNVFETWRVNIVLGQAHTWLGYHHSLSGRYKEASDEYKQAIPYWRQLPEFRTEHSNTLNNLAWAASRTGDFTTALLYVRDGLRIRQLLGSRYLLALSYNTLGLIEIENDTPMPAEIHCRRAWEIFRDMERDRGIGLASIGLARALRRQAVIPDLHEPAGVVTLLKEAEQRGREAVRIFSKQHKEPVRLIEALLELGCVYRDWANVSVPYERPRADYTPRQLAEQSERNLRRAIQMADTDELVHYRVDTLVNLAWLHYYNKQEDKARRVIEDEVLPVVPSYLITEKGVPQLNNPVTFVWTHLGKAYNLLAVMTFAEYNAAIEQHRQTGPSSQLDMAYQHLAQAAREWTLSLAYDQLFAVDTGYARRRDLDWLHNRVSRLNAQEMEVVYTTAKQTAETYALDKPTELQKYLYTMFGKVAS